MTGDCEFQRFLHPVTTGTMGQKKAKPRDVIYTLGQAGLTVESQSMRLH